MGHVERGMCHPGNKSEWRIRNKYNFLDEDHVALQRNENNSTNRHAGKFPGDVKSGAFDGPPQSCINYNTTNPPSSLYPSLFHTDFKAAQGSCAQVSPCLKALQKHVNPKLRRNYIPRCVCITDVYMFRTASRDTRHLVPYVWSLNQFLIDLKLTGSCKWGSVRHTEAIHISTNRTKLSAYVPPVATE
jgi:hypothetical protein